MKRLHIFFFLLVLLLETTMAYADLVASARDNNPERYNYALEQGAKFIPTPDGKAFFILWKPEEQRSLSACPPFIVTLHGHSSWATDEFYLWHKSAQKHGYGIIALQWWLGGGDSTMDYLSPQEIYRYIESALRHEGAERKKSILHGFSRGSANSYAVAALDNQPGNQFFRLIVSNAGGFMKDFPPNADIISGVFGKSPFSGLYWAMYCGTSDENPSRDGCIAMEQAKTAVESFGGKVLILIKEPNADHGGFHRNPQNIEKVFGLFGNK